MQTIARRDRSRGSETEEARSMGVETDGGTIEGILWALVILVPIYTAIIWILMSY